MEGASRSSRQIPLQISLYRYSITIHVSQKNHYQLSVLQKPHTHWCGCEIMGRVHLKHSVEKAHDIPLMTYLIVCKDGVVGQRLGTASVVQSNVVICI